MVEKNLELLRWQADDGMTVLHNWVAAGKLHPFEYVLNSNLIAPHLRRDFIDQLSTMDNQLGSPLVFINSSINDDALSVKMAQVLVNAYKQERAELFLSPDFMPPWLVTFRDTRWTPLHGAIAGKREELALYYLFLDKIKFLEYYDNLFPLAIELCPRVAEEILGFILQQDARFIKHLTFDDGRNALHHAPKCTEGFLRQLLETHPEYISEIDDNGFSILHSWIEMGELWPFQYVTKGNDINPQYKSTFLRLLIYSNINGRNPLHLAAESKFEEVMVEIVKVLYNSSQVVSASYNVWLHKDDQMNTPIDVAISNRHENLALLLLSMVENLEDVEANLLFKAIENECHQVVKFFLNWAAKSGDLRFLKSSGRNVLHLAWKSTEENGRMIIERWPHLINEHDEEEKTPLEIVSAQGTSWLVKLILQRDRSSILKAPKAWVPACKRGDLSTILAFVDNSTYFRYICREFHDSPLHHVKFDDYNSYQKLFERSIIQELKNSQDSEGDTPLHKAIKDRNKDLTEVLFTMEDIHWNIKNDDQKTAMDFLEEVSCQDSEWDGLCKVIGVNPRLKINYIQRKTDVKDMRETISLVAALLATITFTGGFTLPGGINSDNGEAIFAKKAIFLVFLIADTYAMCCSMLILFSIIWSMICDSNRSSFLADRSLGLLKHSLYGTLIAFMTGVYLVTHKNSLWIAIVVIIMCSLTVILAQRQILYKMFEILNFVTEKAYKIRVQIPSTWNDLTSCVERNNPRATTSNNQDQDEGALLLTSQGQNQETTTPDNNQSEDKDQIESKLDSTV